MQTILFTLVLVGTAQVLRRHFQKRYDISDDMKRFNRALKVNDQVGSRLKEIQ